MLDNSLVGMPKRHIVGSDLIASLSIGLYSNPLEIYRELVQNAADAYQLSGAPPGKRPIDIKIDRIGRQISFCDHAIGLSAEEMTNSLFSIGNSQKRGKELRGFRGIGRLAALGYCKELIFRSRRSPDAAALEITLDSVALYQCINNSDDRDIESVLEQISTISKFEVTDGHPDCFFECVLKGVRARKNDILLNPDAVSTYLSEIAPVGFSADFSFAKEIYAILGDKLAFEVEIFINNSESALNRPHIDKLVSHLDKNKAITTIAKVMPISDVDDDFESMAKGWVLHHDYPGALPQSLNTRGLRLRVGNIQVGDERVLEYLFKETRFNSWCIGEIHITSPMIKPNIRRDNLEPSPALDNLENSLRILTRNLSQICRERSMERNKKVKTNHRTMNLSKNQYLEVMDALKLEEPFPDKITLSPKS